MSSDNPLVARGAELFGLSASDLLGESRSRQICTARHAVAYALRRRCPYLSLLDIARLLRRSDHSTIASSLQAAERLSAESYFAVRLAVLLDEVEL